MNPLTAKIIDVLIKYAIESDDESALTQALLIEGGQVPVITRQRICRIADDLHVTEQDVKDAIDYVD